MNDGANSNTPDQEARTRNLTSRAPGSENMIGSYRIIEQIGEGAMGSVVRAEHVQLGREVALKILAPELSQNKETIGRFFAEACAVNKINHKNIVEISDYVEDQESGLYYTVMELLHGMSLQRVLQQEGPLSLQRCLDILRQITSALQAAHDVGIIHRDLKPENIYLVRRSESDDFVKILDFGIAKLVERQGFSPLGMPLYETAPGFLLGTPTYMSPEQACGRKVDHRSDIYSLGIIFFELVTGSVPFASSSIGELVIDHTVTPPPRIRDFLEQTDTLPPRLEPLILRCLEKAPERRPQSMREVGDEIELITRSLNRRQGWLVPDQRLQRNVRWAFLALGVFLLAAGIGYLIANLL